MVFTEVLLPSALLLAACAAHHYSSTPPRIAQQSTNHLLDTDEKRKVEQQKPDESLHDNRRLSHFALRIIAGTKYAMWFLVILEVIARSLSLFPNSTLSIYLLPILISTNSSTLQPTLLAPLSTSSYIALASLFAGAFLRHSCFQALGRHFSFTHTTLAEHSLISSGPYAYARHPSYTGELFVRVGAAALLLRAGSFAAQSGALTFGSPILTSDISSSSEEIHVLASATHASLTSFGGAPWHALVITLTRVALFVHIGWNAFNLPYLFMRAPREDAALRERFGEQWDAYAVRVPYRFVPGLF